MQQSHTEQLESPGTNSANSQNVTVGKEKPYSIYTRKEKWFIVSLIAFAGLFRHGFLHRSYLFVGVLII
jgi:hypothetical protein